MRRTLTSLSVIACQFLIVGFFMGTLSNDNVKIEKYVSTIHNENLNKIATSVSLLFDEDNEEEQVSELEEKLEELTLEELPSM